MKQEKRLNTDTLYKIFIYVALITLAIVIIIRLRGCLWHR